MILFVCLKGKDIEILSKHISQQEMFADDILNRFPNGTIDYYRNNGIPEEGFFDVSKWPKLRYSIVDTEKVVSSVKKPPFFSKIVQEYRD